MDAVDHEQKQVSEEKISETSETELLMKISAEELKSVLENLVESKLSTLQVHMQCVSSTRAYSKKPNWFLYRWIYCPS